MNLHSRHRLQSPQESKSSNTDESPSREQELRSPAYSFVGVGAAANTPNLTRNFASTALTAVNDLRPDTPP
ncbi:hypothetical protein M407DRAFT_30492 [Tulasnella calospora MUT 4182]|uniref:Uncharacterized protein n=1 Tax=Tulasnella calospora MUT 4182 TaxID=1051891 RepID=A0A0C3PXN7_9AGAM|nr:hypothetical protein M407DRAFT_30492 [Tulasnella calospora MUT 4182]